MNYYPFHIGDFRSGTINMSRMSRWIYRDLLDIYYDTEKPLPLDLDLLCDIVGAEEDGERKIVERLLRFKFEKTEDGFRHAICDKVIEEYRIKAETAKANGKRGGRPAKAKDNQEKPSGFLSGSNQVPISKEQETGSQTNQEPITNNQEPLKTKEATPSALPDLFDGIDLQVVRDFKALRTKQKAAITKTAIDGIQREANKAGISLERALTICCERGWRGFKAEWVANQPARASPGGYESEKDRSRREASEQLTGRKQHEQRLEFIDIDEAGAYRLG